MLFNSQIFVLFFLGVLLLYWRLNKRNQNTLLLIASYVFYGAWNWPFLGLLLLSTSIDYVAGIKIEESSSRARKKFFLTLSIAANLIILGYFKYFNFFIDSFNELVRVIIPNFQQIHALNIILPVGISFYTFQSISYGVDVYRGQQKAVRNFFDYALFIAFFPQLVAGPIERAPHIIPQVLNTRSINWQQMNDGLWLILVGLLKKIVVADGIAVMVNQIFNTDHLDNGFLALLGSYGFALQIYCDFSGYSDIARGTAKMMGFELMHNFNHPYIAKNPSDFWRRWHISLSTFLRDYLYVPLGGNRISNVVTYRNLLITMVIGGLWHGAAWNFVLWGAFHGVWLCLHRVLQPRLDKLNFKWMHLIAVIVTLHLVCYSWILFRADSFEQIRNFTWALFNLESYKLNLQHAKTLALFALPIVILETLQIKLATDCIYNKLWRPACVLLVGAMILIMLLFNSPANEFIYFAF